MASMSGQRTPENGTFNVFVSFFDPFRSVSLPFRHTHGFSFKLVFSRQCENASRSNLFVDKSFA